MKKLNYYIILIFALFFSDALQGQVFEMILDDNRIVTVDLSAGCSFTDRTVVDLTTPLTDIAYDADGNLYGVTGQSLYRVDINSGQVIKLLDILPEDILQRDHYFTGMTGIRDTLILGTRNDLATGAEGTYYKYAISSGQLSQMNMSEDLASSGDLTVFENKIYVATVDNKLRRFDFDGNVDPWEVTYSGSNILVFGIISTYANCDDALSYSTVVDTSTNMTSLVEINLNTSNQNDICAFSEVVNGAASNSEYLGADCQVFVDLDADNNNSINEIFQLTTACTDSTVLLSDIDGYISATGQLESIEVLFVNPDIIIDVNNISNNFVLSQNISGVLITRTAGSTPDEQEFIDVLRSITIESPFDDVEDVEVRVTDVNGNTASSNVQVTFNSPIELGADTTLTICDNLAPFMLNELINPTLIPNTSWTPTRYNTTNFEPAFEANPSVVSLDYISPNDCPNETRTYTFDIVETIGLNGEILPNDTSLCVGDTAVINALIPISHLNYSWNVVTSDTFVTTTVPGVYRLTVDVANGCQIVDSTRVVAETCFSCEIYVPNAFRPVDAKLGQNLTFNMFTECNLSFVETKIYDRWGALVSLNRQELPPFNPILWDGRIFNSLDLAPSETYLYEISFGINDPNITETFQRTGTINLFR